MASVNAPTGTTSDWIIDKLLRGVINTALAMPFEQRLRFMGATLAHAIGPLAGYRRRAVKNLRLIYPDMPPEEHQRIAKAVCDNFGRTLIENYSWRAFGERLSETPIQGAGLDALDDARTNARPVLFVTGHLGNHEVPRHLLTQRGHTIGGLFRPMKNPYFNAHYAQTMQAWGGPVFTQGRRGTAQFIKHLQSGGMATLLFDVAYSQGHDIPFLGHMAKTATSAAEIALRTDALVLPYFAIRQPDGIGFDVTLEAPITHGDPLSMMADMTQRLEAKVQAHPEQWFWVHKRWKNAGQKVDIF
jgi:KDO2-lipid IV(A) lauroyltransferase